MLIFVLLEEIFEYAEKKEIYNVECRVKSALNKLIEADYKKNSSICHDLTKDLALTKMKLELFKAQTKNLTFEYNILIEPLMRELENRIATLRKERIIKFKLPTKKK